MNTRICILPLLAAALMLSGCKSTPRDQTEVDAAARDAQLSRGLALAREAQANQKAGNLALAVRQYKEGLLLNPDQTAAWNNLGILLMGQKNYLDAATSFRRAADLAQADPRPYENLGLCYREAGHYHESVEYYGMSLERDAHWLPSLRGAVLGSMELQLVDEVLLERIDRALMVEKDDSWRLMFQQYKTRVQGELKAQANK